MRWIVLPIDDLYLAFARFKTYKIQKIESSTIFQYDVILSMTT